MIRHPIPNFGRRVNFLPGFDKEAPSGVRDRSKRTRLLHPRKIMILSECCPDWKPVMR